MGEKKKKKPNTRNLTGNEARELSNLVGKKRICALLHNLTKNKRKSPTLQTIFHDYSLKIGYLISPHDHILFFSSFSYFVIYFTPMFPSSSSKTIQKVPASDVRIM
ncbi:hypothetical protein FQA47_020708 [Oryzias melastigma]|uniref:Uncharacterized protein n=1 Tax=Oryzias melastigma TaxID=30732 RepID=A0A834FEB2_ORYME|nr:hypothetical protein FQA47_020708 [Oryzias melastigma]